MGSNFQLRIRPEFQIRIIMLNVLYYDDYIQIIE